MQIYLLNHFLDNLSIKYHLIMKILTVGNLKAQFSQVIEDIKHGEEITIAYGKKHQKLETRRYTIFIVRKWLSY